MGFVSMANQKWLFNYKVHIYAKYFSLLSLTKLKVLNHKTQVLCNIQTLTLFIYLVIITETMKVYILNTNNYCYYFPLIKGQVKHWNTMVFILLSLQGDSKCIQLSQQKIPIRYLYYLSAIEWVIEYGRRMSLVIKE